jgi:hypothetical protein
VSWIDGTEKFGSAMQHVWTNVANTIANSLLKTGEQMIANAVLQKSILDGTKVSDAAAAARHTFASVAAIPIIGWALAPEAAAAAFAAVMAFERGGITPAGGPTLAMLHPKEMVLDQTLTRHVMESAGNGGGSSTAIHAHFYGAQPKSGADMSESDLVALIKRAQRRGALP